ncbi:MAG: GTP-binding protein [Cyanobacteria bacterium P01_D01_bin.105]
MFEGYLSEGGLSEDKPAISGHSNRLPVTIITGFAGSGKTTLLSHILRNTQNLKVAVLVSAFEGLNFEGLNIHTQHSVASQQTASSEQTMVELSNGCICGTINENLVNAVYQVLERKEQIDYLVIEASGLADPLPLMMTFAEVTLKALTRLESVLGMVDAKTFGPALLKNSVYASQLIHSDVILLNKTDLVSADKANAIEQDIHLLKSGARILSGSLQSAANLPLSIILNTALADAEPDAEPDAFSERELCDHLVSENFISIPFRSDRPFNFNKFDHFLMQQLPDTIFRAKGILWFDDQPQRYRLQLAGKRCDLSPDTSLKAQTPPSQNQLIFIGHRLNPLQIHQQLINCLSG